MDLQFTYYDNTHTLVLAAVTDVLVERINSVHRLALFTLGAANATGLAN